MTGSDETSNVRTSGPDNEQTKGIRVWLNQVGPRYFSTLGIPLVAGREFRFEDDLRTAPVAIVNETMAHKFFPGRSAIGERLGDRPRRGAPAIEIVGVVRDAKAGRVGEEDHPFAFTPYLQDPNLGSLTFYLRGELPPDRLAPAARAAVASPRSAAPGLRRQDADGPDPRVPADGAAHLRAVRRLRRPRGASGGDRDLRRPRLLGRRAAAGDRRAHGPRRRPGDRAPPGPVRGRTLPCHRRGRGTAGRLGAGPGHRVDSVRRQGRRSRSSSPPASR